MKPFESICVLASQNSWCCNLACTTCGCGDFRRALSHIAKGFIPGSPEWENLSPRAGTSRRFSEIQKERILNLCAAADLKVIADSSRFPDWLGYCGVVLAFMAVDGGDSMPAYKSLSDNWIQQFQGMLAEAGEHHLIFQRILEDPEAVLSWKDLGLFESQWEMRMRRSS